MVCPGILAQRDQLKDILANLADKRVVLLGLGLFGGGEGAARFLAHRGARVIVSDLKTPHELAPVLGRLSDLPIQYELGPGSQNAGRDGLAALRPDLVVINPAVRKDAPLVRLWHDRGVPITTATSIFLVLCRAPVAAVTGSVGKSTTTAMLAAMLQQAGRSVRGGGNMGGSLLPVVDKIGSEEFVVLEMSSFQLEDLEGLRWKPHVAVLTNIIPNHCMSH